MKTRFVTLCAAAAAAVIAVSSGAAASLAASSTPSTTDTQPPSTPHLLRIAGLGGCEIDMRIGLSTDNITPQDAIRYQVLSNGVPVPDVLLLADTRGSKPGFGNLDAFVQPKAATASLSIRAIDQAGNESAPSNSINRRVTGPC